MVRSVAGWSGALAAAREVLGGWAAGREREEGSGPGFGLGRGLGFSWVSFLILFLFYFQFKQRLNSNIILNSNHTQIKVCTSMNATQIFKLRQILITCETKLN